jgi:hypothetical protein
MKNTKLLFTLLLASWSWHLVAQPLNQKVTIQRSNEPLGQVLAGMSQDYGVRFSYSPDFIPLKQRVSLNVVDAPLRQAMDQICEQAPVAYTAMGGQVLLKPDKSREQLGQLETLSGKVRQTSPLYPEPLAPSMKAERERLKKEVPAISQTKEVKVIKGQGYSYKEIKLDPYRLPRPEETARKEQAAETRLAQVSLLPFLGTNTHRSNEITNKVSVNLLWGTNGGVDGLEVGGLLNSVKKDVQGVQVAGIGSLVGGEVKGTQVGGIFNINQGCTAGVQVAGIINITEESAAVQAAGLGNIVKGTATGVQAAGLFNITGGDARGVQAAGLFNHSGGEVKTQAASLFNVAQGVKGGQASLLFNKAKTVEGFQIGLLNFSDTISGLPIGLLSIVRQGYNRFELSGSDLLYANAGLKLGAHAFYNVFHLGMRWDEGPAGGHTAISWGLGYGLGSAITLNPRLRLNIEALAIHLNEQEAWTRELNLLNQLRFTLDFHKPGKRRSFFAGPVANLMVSRRADADTGIIGSQVFTPPYTLLDKTGETTSTKLWVGLQAGIRL